MVNFYFLDLDAILPAPKRKIHVKADVEPEPPKKKMTEKKKESFFNTVFKKTEAAKAAEEVPMDNLFGIGDKNDENVTTLHDVKTVTDEQDTKDTTEC